MSTDNQALEPGFVFLPAISGEGVVVRRSQIVGARPNGPDGSIVYSAVGPSLYTTLTTRQIAGVVGAEIIKAQG